MNVIKGDEVFKVILNRDKNNVMSNLWIYTPLKAMAIFKIMSQYFSVMS
jgi:hypothetical protein